MVRRHFLFLSSVTPTRNEDRGVGPDSPAELLFDPCGTLSAGSVLPSFCIGVKGGAFSDCEPVRWFLALENKAEAFATELLRLFFSVVGLEVSSVDFLP